MSFRESLQKIAEAVVGKAEVAEPEPVVELPPKQVFSDGVCNVCGEALYLHKDSKDCNGWPLVFIDEAQAVVKAREDAAAVAAQEKVP